MLSSCLASVLRLLAACGVPARWYTVGGRLGARPPPTAIPTADPSRSLLLPLRLMAAALVEAAAGEGGPEAGRTLMWEAAGGVLGGLQGFEDVLPMSHWFMVGFVMVGFCYG